MNKIRFLLLIIVLAAAGNAAVAQSNAAAYKKQAQTFLDNKEYIKARYYFLQAYNSFAQHNDMANAVECGVKASALYHRENYYKEAFDVLRRAETILTESETAGGKSQPQLQYPIVRERMQMYMKLKNGAKTKELVGQLNQLAKATASDSIANDALYAQANYYYTFGMPQQGDAALDRLVAKHKEAKEYGKVSDCYKTLIGIATKANNARLTSHAYDKLMAWNDSVRALMAADELAVLTKKYDESLTTIEEKDSTISTKQYTIVALCVLAAVLAGALVFGGIVLMRFIILTRKQKRTIETANEHARLKNEFIANISSQLRPTIEKLDQSLPPVKAIQEFLNDVQELSDLENSLGQKYEPEECNAQTFCQDAMDGIKNLVKPGVSLVVDAPKVSIPLCREPLEQVLHHLLVNAALHTPDNGRISLELKKRGAKLYQLIITDSGEGIAEESSADLFKPFSTIRDLTLGDGLGLPICNLKLTKMGGSISLDTEYKRGAKFVIALRS